MDMMADAVKAGSKLLELHISGWYLKVDPVLINQADIGRNVLSLLFGSVAKGCASLGTDFLRDGADFGFDIGMCVAREKRREAYEELTRFWRIEIIRQRMKEIEARTTDAPKAG